jgi:hypothetical protein
LIVMPHSVRTNRALVQLPKGDGTATQRIEATNTTVLLTDAEYARIPQAIFSSGELTDLGAVGIDGDAVVAQGAHVAAVGALTGAAAAGATPTKAEHDALVADLATIRTALNATIAALTGTGKALA